MVSFRKEFRRQIRLALAAAIGFIIAFVWKDFVIKLTGDALSRFLELNPITSTLAIAIVVTFIGVLIILISSRILK
ncbi:MAG: hypothetical protein QT10_C0001G0164 [archaeon GW2011_AR19]|nr:MAG: hypothetical protein QT10_C0001G0164 [archaeon GW2011_AR19]